MLYNTITIHNVYNLYNVNILNILLKLYNLCIDITLNMLYNVCIVNNIYKLLKERSEKVIQGRLGYNSANDRYGLLVSDLWENDGFHCGEPLEVLVDDKWVETRMEMSIDREWYLVGTPYCGNLEYVRARIKK